MSLRVLVLVPPWLGSAEDRDALVAAAARLGPSTAVEVLTVTRARDPAAVAAHLAQCIDACAPTLLLVPAGPDGEQVAAWVAAARGGCALGRCSGLGIEGSAVVARRAVFGGRAELGLRSTAPLTCAAIRPDAVDAGAAAAPVQHTQVALDAPAPFPSEPVPAVQARPRVEGARIVVSGGRGIGGAEGFDLLARVATAVGGGLGGSLPAVDAGWVPVAHQVGQSGKFVSPRVYLAVGISGTPQHLAGIAPSARIIALNSDRDAPIFARCAVAIEGDWREILPLLAARLEAAAAG
jgi:electron transfer flavoprotein alpha subunit